MQITQEATTMTENFDWLKWQGSAPLALTPSQKPAPLEAIHHFRKVSQTLAKYRYRLLTLSQKDVSPAPYYLHITRSTVTLAESTPGGAVQTRLDLNDGTLWRDNRPVDDSVRDRFIETVFAVQAGLEKNTIKIAAKREEEK